MGQHPADPSGPGHLVLALPLEEARGSGPAHSYFLDTHPGRPGSTALEGPGPLHREEPTAASLGVMTPAQALRWPSAELRGAWDLHLGWLGLPTTGTSQLNFC